MSIPINPIVNRPSALVDTMNRPIPDSWTDESFLGDYQGGQNLIYKGFALPGASQIMPVWQISKLTYDGNSNITMIQWPLQIKAQQIVGTLTNNALFTGTVTIPYFPGTVLISVSTHIFSDPSGSGVLTAGTAGDTGTINYSTGAISLTFNPTITVGNAVYAYSIGPVVSADYLFPWVLRTVLSYQ